MSHAIELSYTSVYIAQRQMTPQKFGCSDCSHTFVVSSVCAAAAHTDDATYYLHYWFDLIYLSQPESWIGLNEYGHV